MSSLAYFRFYDSGVRTGERGYAFKLPRPIPARFLHDVAIVFNRAFSSRSHRPLHFIAIANSGVPLATAVLMYRFTKLDGINDQLSIVDPDKLELIPSIAFTDAPSIVIDNSINSGDTLRSVLQKLRANTMTATLLVKLIDYEDHYEKHENELLRAELGVSVFSLYRKSEILASLAPAHRAEVERIIATKGHTVGR